jgi:hypothetical protein
MKKNKILILAGAVVILGIAAAAEYLPDLYWTFLPKPQIDVIVGEASGRRPRTSWTSTPTTTASRRVRRDAVRPRPSRTPGAASGPGNVLSGEAWDGIKGELWRPPRLEDRLQMDEVGMLAAGAPPGRHCRAVCSARHAPEIGAAEGGASPTEGSLAALPSPATRRRLGVV